MAKKKSVFEKLGLIEQIDEDIEEIEEFENFEEPQEFEEPQVMEEKKEVAEDNLLFEPREASIKEEFFEDADEMLVTKEDLNQNSLYEKSFNGDLFDRVEEQEKKTNEMQKETISVVETNLFGKINQNNDNELNKVDPFEQMARDEVIKKEKERIQKEINEYEQMTQTLKQTITSDKLLNVSEIYEIKELNYDKKKTIFMVDEFINALPDSLPTEVKRESVKSIITASGINLDNLMEDAYKRLDTLNREIDMQLSSTDEIIVDSNEAISELEAKILEIKKQINERKKKQDESKHGIEYETQRILNIVEFINPQG